MWLKLCGVQKVEHARRLAELDLDALGINRYEPSSRFVPREQAVKLTQAIRSVDSSIDLVGVYVNEGEEELREDYSAVQWDVLQLHGDESPDYVRRMASDHCVMKAFQVDEDFSMDRLETYDSWSYLLDAYHRDKYGGTGETAPWKRIRDYTDEHRIVLAGGLNSENVRQALRSVNPWGLDVCSGIEDDRGYKDLEQSARFVERVRSINQNSPGNE